MLRNAAQKPCAKAEKAKGKSHVQKPKRSCLDAAELSCVALRRPVVRFTPTAAPHRCLHVLRHLDNLNRLLHCTHHGPFVAVVVRLERLHLRTQPRHQTQREREKAGARVALPASSPEAQQSSADIPSDEGTGCQAGRQAGRQTDGRTEPAEHWLLGETGHICCCSARSAHVA
jgi:hypothetical protein